MLLIFLLLEYFVCSFKAVIYLIVPSMLPVETLNAVDLRKHLCLLWTSVLSMWHTIVMDTQVFLRGQSLLDPMQNSLAMLLQISVIKKIILAYFFVNEFYSLYVYNLIVIQ